MPKACNAWKRCVASYRSSHPNASLKEALKGASKIYKGRGSGKTSKCGKISYTKIRCAKKKKQNARSACGRERVICPKVQSPFMKCVNEYYKDPAYKDKKWGELVGYAHQGYEAPTRTCYKLTADMKGRAQDSYFANKREDVLRTFTLAQLKRTAEYKKYKVIVPVAAQRVQSKTKLLNELVKLV